MALLVFAALALAQGGDILGTRSPEWPAVRWVQGGPLRLSDLRGRVVLIRFFMDSRCPLCRETAPALNELDREFGPKGLVVIGFYTPKPRPRATSISEVREYARSFGFRFPIAVDDEWNVLRKLWLDRVPDATFTSASLLIDRNGVVRHVQPGGAYAKDSKDSASRRDYRAMRKAVIKLIEERSSPAPERASSR
jgi:peroxiredoxin